MLQQSDLQEIGYVRRPHGVAGEVELSLRVNLLREPPRFLFLAIDGLPVPFEVESLRRKGSGNDAFARFADVSTGGQAAELCGCEVLCLIADLPRATDDEQDAHVLCGFRVIDEVEGEVGTIVDVLDRTANVLLLVKREDGSDVYVPFHKDLVLEIKPEERTLVFSLPEGLLTLN